MKKVANENEKKPVYFVGAEEFALIKQGRSVELLRTVDRLDAPRPAYVKSGQQQIEVVIASIELASGKPSDLPMATITAHSGVRGRYASWWK